MKLQLTKGKYTTCIAQSSADMDACFALRSVCFGPAGGNSDQFDAAATHVLVLDTASGQAVASYRMTVLDSQAVEASYSAQFYDLTSLMSFEGQMLELGRFCIHPDQPDPDIPRIAWATLTGFVDENAVGMLFGCSSFRGTAPAIYRDAFGLLKERYLAPASLRPARRHSERFDFGAENLGKVDLKSAQAQLPPLLRTYLMMGGWVSDHAVVDHVMNTLHVFTGLEIARIPPARKKLLRALV
ncbi:MAG: GNAT family N-acyltransferase [Sulfitobacter sp.]